MFGSNFRNSPFWRWWHCWSVHVRWSPARNFRSGSGQVTRLWTSNRGLNKAINRLREVLGDDADDPRFIETLPQRGYRFIGDLEEAPVVPSPPVISSVVPSVAPPETELASAPLPVASRWPQLQRRHWLLMAGGLIGAPLLVTRIANLRSVPPRIGSIAVLPLENLSSDPSQEYFSDGMTDELIGEIARIGSLRVISRTSSMQYKKARKSLREIATELNASVRRECLFIQISARFWR